MQADLPPHSPPPLSAQYIVGPLLITNSLVWALWGVLTIQLAFFVRDVRWRRKSSPQQQRAVGTNGNLQFEKRRFGFRRQRNRSRSTFADDDVNPWRKSFIPPAAASSPIGAYPSQTHLQSHARQRSSRSVPSSFDPYSPTTVNPSPLDVDARYIIPPTTTNADVASTNEPSVYLILMLWAFYVFVCLRCILGTAETWRVVVTLWGRSSSDLGPRWVGIVLADCIGPLIFIMTVAYFIYALYFSPFCPSAIENGKRRSALRPLSLVKNKDKGVNVLPDPYPFAFPQSPSSTTHSNPNSHSQPYRHSRSPQFRFWRNFLALSLRHGEPLLLALLTIVVTVCGFVDSVRLGRSPLGGPLKLDAVSLIWYVGRVGVGVVLLVLLTRSLWDKLRRSSWMGRIVCVACEAGGAMLVIAFVALVLMVSWRGGKPPSTLTMVAPAVLTLTYANTVVLHISNSYRRLHTDESRSRGSSFTSSTSTSRLPAKGVGNKIEDIEMGLRAAAAPRGEAPVPATRVDLTAAVGAGSAYSTMDSSAEGSAALRERALAYGREKEREREREEKEKEKDQPAGERSHLERDTLGGGSGSGSGCASGQNQNQNLNAPPSTKVVIPGVGTTGNPCVTETVTSAAKAPSVRSGVSGALSLELPTFRKGRSYRGWRDPYPYGGYPGYEFEDESGDELGSDEWDEELEMSSDEGAGGTWDYGFANTERERERERAAATLASGVGASLLVGNGTNANGNGTNMGVQSRGEAGRRWQNFAVAGPSGKRSSYPSRPSSFRRSPLINSNTLARGDRDRDADADGAEADEDDDKVSMLSGASRRSRRSRGARHSFYASATPPGWSKRLLPRPLPRIPGPGAPLPPHLTNNNNNNNNPSRLSSSPSAASMSTDSLVRYNNNNNNTTGLTSPAGSILVIGRTSAPHEPSIAEQSVDRAASVAATRASTGSMWSTFSYSYGYGYGYRYPYAFDYGQGQGHGYGSAYPRPVQLPDLDADLQNGVGGTTTGNGAGLGGQEGDVNLNLNLTKVPAAVAAEEQNLGEALALGTLGPSASTRTDTRSPHPYSAAAESADVDGDGEGEGESAAAAARRRWNVHPLKRIADMGRLRF